MRKNLKKGSFTIEAACVMPIILLVLMGVIHLNLYMHNKVWLTAAAYEAALDGSIEGIIDKEHAYVAASKKSTILTNMGFFGASQATAQVYAGDFVMVSYQLDSVFKNSVIDWKVQTEGSTKIIKPASWVRKRKAGSEIFN